MFDDNQATEASFNIANKTLVDFLEVNTIKKGYEFTLTALFFVLFDYVFQSFVFFFESRVCGF